LISLGALNIQAYIYYYIVPGTSHDHLSSRIGRSAPLHLT
jgi:DNA-binding IclR family transcriptional regulator